MNPNKLYFKDLITAAIISVLFVVFIISFSSCKLLSKVNKSSNDSASVKKETETSAKVDTSKSKTESSNTKETVYYPQPIIVPGKDGETKVIFVPQSTKETGSQTQENINYKFEDLRKEVLDSLRVANASKESKTKAGTDWLTIAIVAGIGLLLFKNFIAPYISLIKK